jgi:hypothetical protein
MLGNVYYSEANAIRRVTPAGAIYHYAGKYYGTGGYGDGPKFDVRVYPTQVAYNSTAGVVEFAEPTDIRKITTDGNVVTIAGVFDNGSLYCTHPVDGSAAVGSCLGVGGFAVAGADTYVADNGYYFGGTRNAPGVWRIDSGGVMHRVATTSDTVGSLSVAPNGDIYVAVGNYGLIDKISGGVVSSYVSIGSSVDGMALDSNGNLLVASAAANKVFKVANDPHITPVVSSIVPDAPSNTDPLLTRGALITPVNNGAIIDHYEYGWGTSTSTSPTKPTQTSTTAHASLYYGVTTPNTNWRLFARAVAVGGEVSAWTSPRTVTTPKAPYLVVLGDSISSGHHKNTGESTTTCKDDNYGYAYYFSQSWLAALPTAWKFSGQYKNLAYSGFATQGTNSVVNGGADACKKTGIASPLTAAKNLLAGRPNTWSRIVISAGINDTNWGAVIPAIIAANRTAAPFGLLSAQCTVLMQAWDGGTSGVQSKITQGASAIVSGLRVSDPAVKITWLDYYNIAGTGTNPSDSYQDIPSSCESAVDIALESVHNAVFAGVPFSVSFVSTDSVMRMDNSRVQPISLIGYALDQILTLFNSKNPPGWPHPNSVGSIAIASLISVS